MHSPQSAPYRDATLDPEQRARDLLSRMTLEEKVAQLGCVWSTALVERGAFSEARAREALRVGTGHVTRIGAASGLRPAERAALANRIQRFLIEETRLGIPAIVHEESTAGLCARDADQLPQAIGLAATWSPELVEQAADLIRRQMLATGARQTLAPVLDVARDPRWGRVEETYGEDPYLVSRMGVAYVRGIQSPDLRQGIAATGKHFLGYAMSEGGHNHKPVHLGPRALREVYARPFLAAIQEAGLASVMNAYHSIDGLPCGGSREILDHLLRGELGFDGVVVADYFTTLLLVASHRVAASKGEAAQQALEAGLDVELPALDCYAELGQRVKAGLLEESAIDRAVLRALRLKLRLGIFEAPYVDEGLAARVCQTGESRGLARRLAQESLVLLKNQGDLLPLARDLRRVAVLGPCADDVRLLQGDYHYPAHAEIIYRRFAAQGAEALPRPAQNDFEAGPFFPPSVTLLAGIRHVVSPETEVCHERGCDVTGGDASGIAAAVACARESDVAILCVGGRSGLLPDCTVGEFRDAADLGLPGAQQALVEAVVATGTPCVVVLVSGRVHALPWIAEHVPALLAAWVPGEEGGAAIADALFGLGEPGGRLPITLPRHVGQVPLYAARHWPLKPTLGVFSPDYSDLPASPLFPFGHGLGYTRFEYADLCLGAAAIAPQGSMAISCRVRNTGRRPGSEVVQLYVEDPVASVTRPVQQLAGFAKLALAPGASATVSFELDASQLAFYDAAMRFAVEPGEVRVQIGSSSEDLRLEGSFRIEGATRVISPREQVPTRVRVSA